MGQTGPRTASELGQRLRERLEADRSEIETLTRAQLTKLSESLSADVNSVANTIESDTQRLRQVESQRRAWLWLRPVVVGLSVFLGVALGTASLTLYLSRNIASQIDQQAELKAATEMQRETLAELHEQTGGIDLTREGADRYLVIPQGMILKPGWTVGKRPAYKLLGD